jgi:hypothetical protein
MQHVTLVHARTLCWNERSVGTLCWKLERSVGVGTFDLPISTWTIQGGSIVHTDRIEYLGERRRKFRCCNTGLIGLSVRTGTGTTYRFDGVGTGWVAWPLSSLILNTYHMVHRFCHEEP